MDDLSSYLPAYVWKPKRGLILSSQPNIKKWESERQSWEGCCQPMHNKIWAKIAPKKIEGMFGWWFWKLFWKIIFDIFRKKKLYLGIEFWKIMFPLIYLFFLKKTYLIELIKNILELVKQKLYLEVVFLN